MDIRLPSPGKPTGYDELPIPRQTPAVSIEHLRPLCVTEDLQRFREAIKQLLARYRSEAFAIEELGDVMMEAIKQDKRCRSMLLFRGFSMHPSYALEAALYKAKNALACYMREGRDINEPVGRHKPPVFK